MKILRHILILSLLFISTNLISSNGLPCYVFTEKAGDRTFINIDDRKNITVTKVIPYMGFFYFAKVQKSGSNGGIKYDFPCFLTDSQRLSLGQKLIDIMASKEADLLGLVITRSRS